MPSTEWTYPQLPPEHGRHEAQTSMPTQVDITGMGVSTAQPGTIPPSARYTETRAFPAPQNLETLMVPGNQEVYGPYDSDIAPGYPVSLRPSGAALQEKLDNPGIPVTPFSPKTGERHDAYLRAQDILNSRHYETQAERLDAELRLADWLLGL